MRSKLLVRLCWLFFIVKIACSGKLPYGSTLNVESDIENLLNKHEPDTEIVRIGVSNPEQLLRQPDLLQGMEPGAVEELLRTKLPVVKTSMDQEGNKHTTTYTLKSDGSVVKETVTERKPIQHSFESTYTNLGDSWPELKHSRWQSRESIEPGYVQRTLHSTWNGPKNNYHAIFLNANTDSENIKPINNTIRLPISWDPNTWPNKATYDNEPSQNQNGTPRNTNFQISNLPNLDTLVRGLYETTTAHSTLDAASTGRSTTSIAPKPIATIDINEIPATAILTHSIPTNENMPQAFSTQLRSAPNPKASPTNDNSHNISNEPYLETNIRSFTKTIQSEMLPRTSDLDANMQDILNRAGINPSEVQNMGGAISKTRTEPDGRVVTTTYRVRTMPITTELYTNSFNSEPARPVSTRFPSQESGTHSFGGGTIQSRFNPYQPESPIAEFLSKVGLTIDFIKSKNGEFVKEIIDDDGRVLTVAFTLSSMLPNDNSADSNQQNQGMENRKPIK